MTKRRKDKTGSTNPPQPTPALEAFVEQARNVCRSLEQQGFRGLTLESLRILMERWRELRQVELQP
ncbi:hypothetical protein [Terriglobus sp. RCC_193]|uniref:hypothetical protein n=1 Tax=Terriglobus sp. RCC_193 TaxID=3239218 RepID=UPI0035236758